MTNAKPYLFQCSKGTTACLLCLLLLLKVTSAGLLDRSKAFVGYTEQPKLICKNQHTDCQKWADERECQSNPYFMRSACPHACQVASACQVQHYQALSPQPWSGYATGIGTKHYALTIAKLRGEIEDEFAGEHFRLDPAMGEYLIKGQRLRGDPWLRLSSLGVGTYLGGEDSATDEQVVCALLLSAMRGWNVIDTARNYRSGRAETAVGEALMTLRLKSHISRDMLFISTKAGYGNDAAREALVEQGKVTAADLGANGNCIHPACLEASITASLTALHLQTVDLLYLHNAAESYIPRDGKQGFLKHLEGAFEALEQHRLQGRIRAYGMANWDVFRVAPDHAQYLSLQEVVGLAARVGGVNHGFRYIQLPVNVAMPEAWQEQWQYVCKVAPNSRPETADAASCDKQWMSATEAAVRLGIGVFTSGPLLQSQLLNSKDIQSKLEASEELSSVSGPAAKLVQLARSTPHITAALVGHKARDHVDSNTLLAKFNPFTVEQHLAAFKQVSVA